MLRLRVDVVEIFGMNKPKLMLLITNRWFLTSQLEPTTFLNDEMLGNVIPNLSLLSYEITETTDRQRVQMDKEC
jgi:hypothetical protein